MEIIFLAKSHWSVTDC